MGVPLAEQLGSVGIRVSVPQVFVGMLLGGVDLFLALLIFGSMYFRVLFHLIDFSIGELAAGFDFFSLIRRCLARWLMPGSPAT